MTTNPMLEAVARGICAANNSGASEFDATGLAKGDEGYSPEWLYYVDDAKAAIQALMEPSEEMLDASWHTAGESKEMRPRTHAHYKRHYQAMLRAALGEG